MDYSVLVDKYEKLEEIPSKLKKAEIISGFLKSISSSELPKIVLLLQGRVFPSYSEFELGIATQMMIKSISQASGFSPEKVEDMLKRNGDLGLTAEQCIETRKQQSLLKKKLTVDHVFENLQKLAVITGEGSQNKKLSLISELIISAQPKEAKYIVRTVLGELRVGVAEGIIRDAVVSAFLIDEKSSKEEKEKAVEAVDYAWNILSDFGEVARIAKEKKESGLRKVKVELGKPVQVMLGITAEKIEDVTENYKILAEWKYDGARVQCHKKGDKVWVYTRRLENVTPQFPDIVKMIKDGIKVDECIVEGETLGIDKNGIPIPFQILSQRIHRKYDIEKMVKEIPIQVNLFDIVYLNGKNLFDKPLTERKEILNKIIKPTPGKFQLAKQIVSNDLTELEKFYKEALNSKQEGIFLKVLDSPYVFGRHVGGWYKIKPVMETLDLIVISATWGEGSRAKWLTSYELACRDPDTGKFLSCGMMSTGLTEEEYKMMTETLKPLITQEKGRTVKVKPKIIIEVKYQEIQKSVNYESGMALRFPALSRIRDDKGPNDVDSLDRVKKLYESQGRAG